MRSAFVRVLYAALRQAVGDLRARSRRTPYMPLCTRSEVYIRLVCPGIGLSQGAADDARRQGAGLRLNTQLVVSLLSKGLWVVARWSREMRAQKNGFFPSSVANLARHPATYGHNSDPWPLAIGGLGLKSLCVQQRLTNELTAILLNFLLCLLGRSARSVAARRFRSVSFVSVGATTAIFPQSMDAGNGKTS